MFTKGHKINVGRKHSEESRRLMRISHRARLSRCGRTFTVEDVVKAALAEVAGFEKLWVRPPRRRLTPDEVKRKLSALFKGRPLSAEIRAKMGASRTGPKNHRWAGGVTSHNKKIRGSPEHKQWSRCVLRRDDYTCRICYRRGGKLVAHHIMPFATYEDLRFEVYNGLTLCRGECHRRADEESRIYL